MEFFNRKEEVIDIQLTQHGKHLLSKGRLSPKYYAFFDDDVIYDSAYAGFGEHPAEAEGRMTTTPRIKTQHAFEGAETRVAKIKQSQVQQQLPNDEGVSVLEPSIPTTTNTTNMSAHLGTSAFNSTKAPAWNIRLLDGHIEESVHYGTGSIKTEGIPQIDVKSTTRVSVLSPDEYDDLVDMDPTLGDSNEFVSEEEHGLQLTDIFEDGSSFQVLGDTIIFDIEEFHTARREFNFDVEVFEIETDENGNEELRPLRFASQGDNMVSNLSYEVDGDIVSNLVGSSAENTNYTDYYIEINTDDQVQLPLLGAPATPLDIQEDIIPANDFDCPDDEEEN